MIRKISIFFVLTFMVFNRVEALNNTNQFNPSSNISTYPVSPLKSHWNIEKGMIARFYPAIPIKEQEFLSKFHNVLGLVDENSQLFLKYDKVSFGAKHRHWGQTYKGIKVKDAELVINLDNQGNIISVLNNLLPIKNFPVSPTLSLSQCKNIAIQGINITNLRGEIKGELVIAEIDGQSRLVYQWQIPASKPYGDWEILLDANTGDEISRVDLRRYSVTGSGQVFIPDPKTAIECDTLHDWSDVNWAIPMECYSMVDLLELNDPIGVVYVLSGPYVNTNPTFNRAAELSPDFIYLRQDDRFEEVNVYYHIDTYQRYIQELGFNDIMNFSISCNVNGTTEDNSWFSPLTWTITYGSGGVDDGEDADVIIHEYGHAIQEDIIPNWVGGHSGAMGEGFGDYIAGTYSLVINPDFHPDWVFTWDGHNQFWAGRWLDMPYHYPENANGEIHDSGQLWSAGLIDVWYDVPDVKIWDKIVFQHHYYLGNGATMEDAANAILLADIEINNANYRQTIIENFAERGFVNPTYLYPIIEHTPLNDTEDTIQVEFPVIAKITSNQPLDSNSLKLFWGIDGAIMDTLNLQPIDNDTFSAVITGPFNHNTINYFLSAADIYGGLTILPEEAPVELFAFYVGPDTVFPEISVFDTLPNTVFLNGNGNVMITAEDNLGIASAQFHYSQEGEDYQSVEMIPIDGDTFYAQVNWSDMEVLEHFYYYFSAQDNSSNQNQTITEEYSFQVLTNVVFDNFENGLDNWLADNGWRLQSLRYFSPVTALNDRNEFGQPASQQEIITLAQPWLPNGLSNLILEFWTLYFFIPQNDTGFVEVNVDDSWVTLDTITGLIGEWEKRSINLEDFINLDSIYVRFHTHANDSFTATTLGWYIDDITLRTDPLVEIGADTQVNLDLGFRLKDISPNPGNGEFNISFYLPNEGKAKLSLFNLLGEKLTTIKEENFTAGLNQVKWQANFPSGVYFVEIRFGTESRIGKILLLK